MQTEIDCFLRELEVEGKYAANTIAAYRNDLHQLREYLMHVIKDDSWADVTLDVVQSYVVYLWDRGYATATVARKLSATHSFFRFMLDRGLIHSDPTATISTPPVKRSPPESPPREAISRLLAPAAGDMTPIALRDRALLEILCATGLRASEIVGLAVEDVSLASSTVRCLSRGRERLVPLSARARQALESYLAQGRRHLLQDREERALFLNYRGQGLTRQGLWLLVQGYAKEAGLHSRITPQTLRNSFAAHLLSEGVAMSELQELLGHVSLHTTRFYTHLQEKGDASHQ